MVRHIIMIIYMELFKYGFYDYVLWSYGILLKYANPFKFWHHNVQ